MSCGLGDTPHPTAQDENSSSVLFGHISPVSVKAAYVGTSRHFREWAFAGVAQLPCVGPSGLGPPCQGVVRGSLGRGLPGAAAGEGSGDLMPAPIPFFFHESCF